MKFKNLFSRNNTIRDGEKKKKRLLKNEGFYIIMFLAVCIVGITAVWVAKSNVDRIAEEDLRNEEINMEGSEIIDIAEGEMENQLPDIIIMDEEDEVYEAQPASNEDVEEPKKEIEPQNQSAKKSKNKTLVESDPKPEVIITEFAEEDLEETGEAVAVLSPDVIDMTWPVDGELGTGFAIETLVYSQTLEHFTTHYGIDIMAEKNTPVKAALSGEIIEVLTDSRLGMTISVKHEDGLITRYSNLLTDAIVKVGDKVSEGQTISGVGNSSVFESIEEPHLHFEVLQDGKNIDPMKYLGER